MLKKLFAVSLLLLIIKPAMAIDHAQYFPAVAQGHSCTKAGSTQLELQDKARINGVDEKVLEFCGMSPKKGGKHCDGQACLVSGKANSLTALTKESIDFWPRHTNALSHTLTTPTKKIKSRWRFLVVF